ncbi:hypothetical protein D3C81_1458390 [compost metagenome]
MDVFERETSHVTLAIDIARRGPNHDVRGDAVRVKTVGQCADHCTHRVTDNNHLAAPKVIYDIVKVSCVPSQRTVFCALICIQIRSACADQVIQHHAETAGEVLEQIVPHGLIAAEAMREHQCRSAFAMDLNVVPALNVHVSLLRSAKTFWRRGE